MFDLSLISLATASSLHIYAGPERCFWILEQGHSQDQVCSLIICNSDSETQQSD